MATWQLQDARAKLSEVVDTAKEEGPQIITRRGVEVVAIMPIHLWRLMNRGAKPMLLEVVQSGPQFDLNIPLRGRLNMRKLGDSVLMETKRAKPQRLPGLALVQWD